jgi:hypothetical protein
MNEDSIGNFCLSEPKAEVTMPPKSKDFFKNLLQLAFIKEKEKQFAPDKEINNG